MKTSKKIIVVQCVNPSCRSKKEVDAIQDSTFVLTCDKCYMPMVAVATKIKKKRTITVQTKERVNMSKILFRITLREKHPTVFSGAIYDRVDVLETSIIKAIEKAEKKFTKAEIGLKVFATDVEMISNNII
jgi:hypothetical protein